MREKVLLTESWWVAVPQLHTWLTGNSHTGFLHEAE